MPFSKFFITTDSIIISNFTYSASPNNSLKILFTNTSENLTETTTYFWDFGDGSTSTEKNPIHIYDMFGNYSVILICNGTYSTDQIIQNVNVTINNLILNLDGSIQTSIFSGNSLLISLKNIDGHLSGLDADLLDGHESDFFTNASNLSTGILPSNVFNDISHGYRSGGNLHPEVDYNISGFMSVNDKIKLDGIESGATADMTASEILTALKTVDGTGSGLDADLLDGFSTPLTNAHWGVIPTTNTSGITVIGKYLDFYETDTGTTYQRITSNTTAGTISFPGYITTGVTTLCTNLNADLLDGLHSSSFLQMSGNGALTLLSASTDLDTVIASGWYRGNSLIHAPQDSSVWWYIVVYQQTSLYVKQLAYGLNLTQLNQVWQRQLINGIWQSWIEEDITAHKAETDPHTQYILANGTRSFSGSIQSTVATGTKPLTIVSTTLCDNLNADLLDGLHSTNYVKNDESFLSGAIRKYTNVLAVSVANGSTGTIKITCPESWTNTMLQFEINIYEFTANSTSKLLLSGYPSITNSIWTYPSIIVQGALSVPTVRFGHDGTKCCILIGNTTTVWSFFRLIISNVMASYSNQGLWGTGYSSSLITDETGITISGNPTVRSSDLSFAFNILPSANFNDTSHGNRGNGTLHSIATTSVNGFMSSTDKTKLDGIESGATADMTASEILTALLTVDGSGSNLSADLLDGFHLSSYGDRWGVVPVVGAAGATAIGKYLDFYEDDLGSTYQRITSDSTSGIISFPGYITTGVTTLCTNLNADLLDGLHASSFLQMSGNGALTLLSASTDLDTVVASGWYRGQTLVHAPQDSAVWWYIIVYQHNTSYVKQLAYGLNTLQLNQIWQRQLINGVWQAWIEEDITAHKAEADPHPTYKNASNLSSGTIPGAVFNDTSHGNRGNGTLHSVATNAVAGFMPSGWIGRTHVADINTTTISTLTGTMGTTGTALVDVGTSFSQTNINNNDRRLMDQINNLKTVVDSLRTQFNLLLTRLEGYELLSS